MTPCHRSLTARCHEAIDHLGSSGFRGIPEPCVARICRESHLKACRPLKMGEWQAGIWQ
ncbi:hypothetical protein [Arsenophonus nasoniae]|uniref:hypothetical protein n=1 Tax=Arsenophonus nasoniae TaxID=638 RepID=UPI002469BF8A|nr:hypothetical protein [Arsenophonus nasoniae]